MVLRTGLAPLLRPLPVSDRRRPPRSDIRPPRRLRSASSPDCVWVTWEWPGRDALGARLADVAPLLDAVAARLGGAVAPLHALAYAMEEAQAVIAVAIRSEREAEHAYLAPRTARMPWWRQVPPRTTRP